MEDVDYSDECKSGDRRISHTQLDFLITGEYCYWRSVALEGEGEEEKRGC